MREPNQANGRNGKHRRLKTTLNKRVLVTLLVGLMIVLAGCTGVSDLPGGSGGGADDGAAAGGDSASDGGNGGDGASNSGGADDATGGNSTNETGTTSRSAAGSGGGNGSEDDGGASGSNGTSSAESDGAKESVESDGAAKTDIEPRYEDWYNATKNTYVFEIDNATSGSGTATIEPPADLTRPVVPNVTYEGDKTFEQYYRSASEESVKYRGVTGPVLDPLGILTSIIGYIDEKDLTVGYEEAAPASYGNYTAKITGVDSYGGIECYATEVTHDGSPYIDTCMVPHESTRQPYLPYVAQYNEDGKVVLEIKLKEIKKG